MIGFSFTLGLGLLIAHFLLFSQTIGYSLALSSPFVFERDRNSNSITVICNSNTFLFYNISSVFQFQANSDNGLYTFSITPENETAVACTDSSPRLVFAAFPMVHSIPKIEMLARIGETQLLECPYELGAAHTVLVPYHHVWLTNGMTISNQTSQTLRTNTMKDSPEEYSCAIQMVGCNSISCPVETAPDPIDRVRFMITKVEPISIVTPPDNLAITEFGSAATFNCSASGTSIEIIWNYNGMNYTASSVGCIITSHTKFISSMLRIGSVETNGTVNCIVHQSFDGRLSFIDNQNFSNELQDDYYSSTARLIVPPGTTEQGTTSVTPEMTDATVAPNTDVGTTSGTPEMTHATVAFNMDVGTTSVTPEITDVAVADVCTTSITPEMTDMTVAPDTDVGTTLVTPEMTDMTVAPGMVDITTVTLLSLGLLIVVLIICSVIVCVSIVTIKMRRRKKRSADTNLPLEAYDDVVLWRPSTSSGTPNSQPETVDQDFDGPTEEQAVNLTCQSTDGELTEVPDSLKIPSSSLKLARDPIGHGETGIVYRGQLLDWNNVPMQEVAVKTLKGLFSPLDIENLKREIVKMKDFQHSHVMPLIGVCMDAGPGVSMVIPYMARGSLLDFLRKERANIDLDASQCDQYQIQLVRKLLLKSCYQVALGMEYLAKQMFIHRDLAARNCMLDSDGNIKVGDFGLAEDVYTTGYFRQGDRSVKLPYKWMAIESLNDAMFTEKSDVWSYGVTMWEVFSSGRAPYPAVDPLALMLLLGEGRRLNMPLNAACSTEIFAVMQQCWHGDPNMRPTFSELVSTMESLSSLVAEYMELENPTQHAAYGDREYNDVTSLSSRVPAQLRLIREGFMNPIDITAVSIDENVAYNVCEEMSPSSTVPLECFDEGSTNPEDVSLEGNVAYNAYAIEEIAPIASSTVPPEGSDEDTMNPIDIEDVSLEGNVAYNVHQEMAPSSTVPPESSIEGSTNPIDIEDVSLEGNIAYNAHEEIPVLISMAPTLTESSIEGFTNALNSAAASMDEDIAHEEMTLSLITPAQSSAGGGYTIGAAVSTDKNIAPEGMTVTENVANR